MQSTTLWIVVGVIVLGLAGVGIYVGIKGSVPAPVVVENAESTPTPLTLRTLLASGGSQKCTFDSSTENSNSSGIVYIGMGQMRGDFTSVSGSEAQSGHFIVKDDTTHVWIDGIPRGFKAAFAATSTTGQSSQLDPDAPVDYSCNAWSVDASMFTLPSDVTFVALPN